MLRVQNGPVWLITLADLVALLLTFFVLIFSMSTIHSDKWNEITKGLPGGSPAIVPSADSAQRALDNIDLLRTVPGLDLGYLDSVVQEQLTNDPLLAESLIRRVPGAVVISLPAHLLFASGSDELKPEAAPALFQLAGLLGNLRNEVAVVGHTDPAPIATAHFPSNWELSLARAASVARALRQVGYRREIEIVGVADGHFDDISPALDESTRRALGRRVDLVVRDTKGT